MILIDLIYNLSLLVALSVVSGFIDARWPRNSKRGTLLQGILFGSAAVIGMLRPVQISQGLIFDGRSVMISLGALFFGPMAAGITCLMTMPLRIFQGGPGMSMGLLVILSSAVIGVGYHLRKRSCLWQISAVTLFGFGILVHAAMLAMTLALPVDRILPVLEKIAWPVMLSYPVATVIIGKILTDQASRLNYVAALRASEVRYRELVEHASSVILRMKPDGTITFFNEFAQRFFGYQLEEILGRNVLGSIVPEKDSTGKDMAEVLHLIGMHPERYATYENENVRKDGTRCWLAWSNQKIMDGSSSDVLCVGTDITARKKAEEESQKSRERFEAILASLNDAVFLVEPTTRLIGECNEAAAMLFGYSRNELIGSTTEMLYVDRAQFLEFARLASAAFNQAGFLAAEYRMKKKDGTVFSTEHFIRPLRSSAGGIVNVVSVVRDISGRIQTEERLRILSSAVEQSPASIVITNPSGQIEYVNSKCTQLTGYTLEEIRGKTPRIFKGGGKAAEEYQKLWSVIANGQVWRGEFHNRKKNGDLFWEDASIAPLVNAGGQITHYLAIKEDITEKKILEERFLQAQKLESIGQLAGGVAHDFNNILAAMMIRLGLAGKLSMGRELSEAFDELSGNVKRAANLTRQLLLFSRRSVMEIEVIDLNDLVSNLLKMLGRLIGEHITVQFNRREGIPPVEADAGMIEQVIMNLSVNARDAMGKEGTLAIGIDAVQTSQRQMKAGVEIEPGPFVCISVSDTGCGMDNVTLGRIFEPFFTTKAPGKGTGLGLATVYGIVAQHKGWVDVESKPGQGSRFNVYLPASASQRVEAAAMEQDEDFSGSETVLLVEDDTELLKVVTRSLRQQGYQVLEAQNGQTAIKIWDQEKEQIELLFSDMVMPGGITGLDLAARFKSQKPQLKVVIASGYNTELAGQHLPAEWDIVYLHKPFQPGDLFKTIRTCLDSRSKQIV